LAISPFGSSFVWVLIASLMNQSGATMWKGVSKMPELGGRSKQNGLLIENEVAAG